MDTQLHLLDVSYETLRRLADQLDRWELTKRRWGRHQADRKRRPKGAGPITSRSLERVEIDHFMSDDPVLIPHGAGFHVQRHWLTVALDHYSGVVVGYRLSFAPPSAASVLAVLRHAILPKTAALPRADGTSEPVPVYGIPDCIVVDNGLDLTSRGVRDACMALGIEVQYCPPRVPWYKGSIERFGRTINQRLVHWLPGTTLGKPLRDVAYDSKKEACILAEDFEALVEQYITEIHNHTPRRTKAGTPLERWRRSIEEFPPRLPVSMDAFDAAVALSHSAQLTSLGIHFAHRDYNSDSLGALWNRIGDKKRVQFKVNPLDLRKIMVIDPSSDEPIPAPCTTPFHYPPVLEYHNAVCQYAKEHNTDPANVAHLSRAEQHLRDDIEEAVTRSKKTQRRAAAQISALARRAAGVQAAQEADLSDDKSRESFADVWDASDDMMENP